jgi:hypothetical protein
MFLVKARNELATSSLDEARKTLSPSRAFETPYLSPGTENQEYADLPLKSMLALFKRGTIITHEEKGKTMLIKLVDYAPKEKKEDDSFLREYEQERMQTTLGGVIASLYRNAKIKTNNELVYNEKESPYER